MIPFVYTCLLPIFFGLVLLGYFVPEHRLVILSGGFVLLFIAYLIEVLFSRGGEIPDFAKMSQHNVDVGEISVTSGSVYVTDKWALNVDATKLEGTESCTFRVTVRELRGKKSRYVISITLKKVPDIEDDLTREIVPVPVDSGFLIFADVGSEKEGLTEDRLSKTVQSMMESGDQKALDARLLSDNNNVIRGIAVVTGEGDGTYDVIIERNSSGIRSISSQFLSPT